MPTDRDNLESRWWMCDLKVSLSSINIPRYLVTLGVSILTLFSLRERSKEHGFLENEEIFRAKVLFG